MASNALERATNRAGQATLLSEYMRRLNILDVEQLPKTRQFIEGRKSVLSTLANWQDIEALLEIGLPEGKALPIPVISDSKGNKRPINRMAAMVRHYLRRRALPYRVMATKSDKENVYVIRKSAHEVKETRDGQRHTLRGEVTGGGKGAKRKTA